MSVMSDSVRPHRWQPTRILSLGFSRQEYWSGLPFPSPMNESKKWKWSLSVVSDSSRPHGLQPTRLLHPWDFPGKSTGVGCRCLLPPSPRVCSNSFLLSHNIIQPFHPLSSPPAFNLSQHQGSFILFFIFFPSELALCINWPTYWNFSFSISPFSDYSGLISSRIDWSPCCPKDFWESSPTPQFKGISSLELSLFIGQLSHPYITTGKTHTFDYTVFCKQSNDSAFLICSLGLSLFLF